MTAHRAVVAVGPASVSRLCCATTGDDETGVAAVDAIDDRVALVDEHPVAVDALWCAVLRSLAEGHRGVLVVHPAWWSAPRVAVLTAAARTVAGAEAAVRARTWLLPQPDSTILVEIAERLVAISGDDLVAVPRLTDDEAVATEVAGVVATMTNRGVMIDAPKVSGAPRLARLIADALPAGHKATIVDDDAVTQLARAAAPIPDCEPVKEVRSSGRILARLAAAGVAVTAAGLALPAVNSKPVIRAAPTTLLIEGGVALAIPADWNAERIVAGPGSARVQITSPADPEAALHLTQTPTPGETLADAAAQLRRAIDAEPAGVFVDFNPTGASAGRPAVTYREVRAAHDVRWTVLLDKSLRISIGCQSRPAGQDAVRDACERAVQTAHAVG
ncbi:type VII secretion-associated protein [Mycobacterium sp. TY814]|uniref:type VII secretion-associated protein n=1 Tax=unclassified Mycobacterium TaxID=2642494 RepID=UPI002741C56C|nr:type VII secretion-associated protein [Mycobacterium sp. TY814]MDP7722271.1 type VII secretion-associated protein [Mycobacterium sp. TY814]